MAGQLQKRFQQILQNAQPDQLAQIAYAEWTAKTPVGNPALWKSGRAPAGYTPGNAKKSTRLTADSVHADYAYAKRLDKGWSRQFGGQGMSKPAIAAVQAYVKSQLKKKGS